MIPTLTLLLATAASPSAAQSAPDASAVTYVCAGGSVLQVAYINPVTGPSLAVVGWEGALIPMQAGPTGSGVRYLAFDAAQGHVWHVKGPEGALYRAAPGSEQTPLLSDCTAVPA